MELTGVLVLSLISLIHATPHDYGGSHVIAGAAGATAGAFSGAGVNPENVKGGYSGSFSKSSASSFASSSASSSSSSFSFSGSGTYPALGSNGVNDENGKNGCTSGNCANGNGNNHSGDVPQHSSNGYGGLGSGAGAIASAGAFASAGSAIPFNGGSLNEPGCSGPNCKPSTSNNECTSGVCENNNDIQVNPHYKSKTTSGTQSNNPTNKNNPGTICTSGTCGPLNSDRKEPYDQSPQGHNGQNTAIRPTSPSRVPAQWSSTSGSNDHQSDSEQESSKDNCANGVCGKPLYEGPSSYNVPILPTGTVPSNNCKNGDCGQHEPKPNIPGGDVSSCTSGNCNNENEPEYDNTYPVFTSSVPKKGPAVHCSSPGCKSHLGQNSPQNIAQAGSPKPVDESFSTNNNGNYKPLSKPIYSSFNLNPSPVQAPTLDNNPNFKPADLLQAPFDHNSSPSCNNGNCKPIIKPIQTNYNLVPAPQNFPSQCSSPGCQPAGPTPNNNGQSDIPKFVPLEQNVSPNCYNDNCKPLIKPIQSIYNPNPAPNAPYSGVSISTTNCVGLNCPSLSPTFSQPQATKPAFVQSYNLNLAPTGHPGCSNGNCFPKPSFGPPLSPAGGQGCINGNCGLKPSFAPPVSSAGGQGCSNGNCGTKPSFGPLQSPVEGQGCSNGNCGPIPSLTPPGAFGNQVPTLTKPAPNKEEKPYTGGFGAPAGILKPNDYSKPSQPFAPMANPTYNKPSFGPPLSPVGGQGCSNGKCGPKPSVGPSLSPVGVQGCSNGNCGPKPSFGPPLSPTGGQGCSNGNCGPKPSFEPSISPIGSQGCSNGNCGPKPSFGPPQSPIRVPCSNGNCGPKPSFGPPLSPTGDQGCSNGNCGPKPSFGPSPSTTGSQGCINGNCSPKPSFAPPLSPTGAQGCINGNCGLKPSFAPPVSSAGVQGCSNGNCGPKPSFGPPQSPVPIPSLTPPGAFGNQVPTLTKPVPKKEEKPYTGGFGAPAGILKPNDYSKPLQPFIPIANPSNNKLIAKPSSTHPPQSIIPQTPPKTFAPTLTNANNIHNHLASSISSAGAFASANSVAYTGGFGGPPGLLKPYDGKGTALTPGDKNQLGQTGNNQGQFQNINVATAGGALNGFGQGGQDVDKNYHGSTNCHGDKCNSSPQTSGNHPSNNGHFGISSAGSFSTSGAGLYEQGHPGGKNEGPHSGGCNSGCSGNVKGGPQTGSYGLSSAGAVSGASAGSFGTSGSFATSSAVAHASAGASTKGGYGRR